MKLHDKVETAMGWWAKVESFSGKGKLVLVTYLNGPFAGHEARLEKSGLKFVTSLDEEATT